MGKKLTIQEIDGKMHIESIGFNSFEIIGIHQYCIASMLNAMNRNGDGMIEKILVDEIGNQISTNEKLQEILNKKITTCEHRWIKTTKDYKRIRKCSKCGEIKK